LQYTVKKKFISENIAKLHPKPSFPVTERLINILFCSTTTATHLLGFPKPHSTNWIISSIKKSSLWF